jgi:phosphatidylserine decarboxylase
LRLTVYGRSVVLKALIITLALDIIAVLIPVLWVKLALLIISVLLFGFTVFFFRDPIRKLPDGLKGNELISPADGKVMLIQEVDENVFLKTKAKLIAIFLSPLNVHVNRIPVSGRVDHLRYVEGGYVAAFNHKSSEKNERTEIGITGADFRILFRQVAGYVARRIVCTIKQGDNVRIGEKFGMIKFGSRVDVVIPERSVVRVSVNQRVIGGETILAELYA